MANQLKALKTYEAKSGVMYDAGYMVVDYIHIEKKDKTCCIRVYVFKDKQSRIDKKDYDEYIYNVKDTDYNTYFDDAVIKADGVSLWSQAYAYIATLAEWADWTSDQ